MKAEEIAALIENRMPGKLSGKKTDAMDPWIEVAPENLVAVAMFLRDEPALAFDYLRNLSAVDYLVTDEKRAKKLPFQPHLEVVYHLFSFVHKHSIVLKVNLPRWKNDQEGELPECPTTSRVWAIADCHAREAYDLMGINFTGHPNLRRILCVEDWEGHPLRKDYKFPLEYHGIRCQ